MICDKWSFISDACDAIIYFAPFSLTNWQADTVYRSLLGLSCLEKDRDLLAPMT